MTRSRKIRVEKAVAWIRVSLIMFPTTQLAINHTCTKKSVSNKEISKKPQHEIYTQK